jgi:hypothetical protein
MSKKFSRSPRFDDFHDEEYDNGYYDNLKERRKLKRMKNAIKSRNIDSLMDLDEEYY